MYSNIECFPAKERFGLTDQMRRAAVSIPSNIAEGQAYFNKREFRHYLRHARGSLAELETQTLIAQRVQYLDETQTGILLNKMDELGRILSGLIRSLEE